MNTSAEDFCFNVNFGASVGRFKLGCHINDLLDVFSNEYPRLNLEVSFCEQEDVTAEDIRVNVPQWGIRFRFQPLSQQLYFIDIHNFDVNLSFNINGYVIRGQEYTTTFNHLQKALGPSFPGKFIDEGQYLLSFDGVGFLFRIPAQYQALYEDGKTLPIVLPDRSSPVLERIYVFSRDFDLDHPEAYPDMQAPTARIVLQDQDSTAPGTHLHLLSPSTHPPSPTRGHARDEKETYLALGMTPQDVVSNLGTPDFASLSPQHAETFIHKYEYKRLGIELFFSRNTHLVYRIVAHTNLVQHQDFGRFQRCGFIMSHSTGICAPTSCWTCRGHTLSSEDEEETGDEEEAVKGVASGKKKTRQKKKNDDEQSAVVSNGKSDEACCVADGPCISATTPWAEARALLDQWFPSSSDAASHDKDASQQHAAIKPVPAGCPFPASQLFAYPSLNVMFEVVDGGSVSSVTVLDVRLIE
eukprot:CAMPEP_0114419164 /NCGR_PEP_ID=MMETSP0103-20121206/3882_1 /TAXON_ID=37642 ORGANISM="Paraphysomonas imperforata, Strain PA2" /NCGR_SAMPLE_ID=MMETSP0103 /ASSEMBLY_ACC=CAM_ASM_000201 /LENGTH=468 /DNA_ID=CAMNT_0001587567 /DNA_START=133 /DNA_END=1539 /DNA_ORIENTATION=+